MFHLFPIFAGASQCCNYNKPNICCFCTKTCVPFKITPLKDLCIGAVLLSALVCKSVLKTRSLEVSGSYPERVRKLITMLGRHIARGSCSGSFRKLCGSSSGSLSGRPVNDFVLYIYIYIYIYLFLCLYKLTLAYACSFIVSNCFILVHIVL